MVVDSHFNPLRFSPVGGNGTGPVEPCSPDDCPVPPSRSDYERGGVFSQVFDGTTRS